MHTDCIGQRVDRCAVSNGRPRPFRYRLPGALILLVLYRRMSDYLQTRLFPVAIINLNLSCESYRPTATRGSSNRS